MIISISSCEMRGDGFDGSMLRTQPSKLSHTISTEKMPYLTGRSPVGMPGGGSGSGLGNMVEPEDPSSSRHSWEPCFRTARSWLSAGIESALLSLGAARPVGFWQMEDWWDTYCFAKFERLT